MEELLRTLLNECAYFERVELTQRVAYYSKDDNSYFFPLGLPEADFELFKSKEKIQENVRYTETLNGFKSIINSGEQPAVEKNSSLLIHVKCATIESLQKLQQQILLVEEDEYFFKKYVILYTDDSIRGLNGIPLVHALLRKVDDHAMFDRFAKEGCSAAIAEFVVVVQLFIKLPFLNLNHGTESFTSLGQKIEAALGIQQGLYEALLTNSANLLQVDFAKPEHEEQINNLLSLLPHD